MMTLPTMIDEVGVSPQTIQPRMAAQTIAEYWKGANVEAGVIDTAFVMATKQPIETMPTRNIRQRSRAPGDVHSPAPAVRTAPTRPAPANCHVTSDSQWLPRSLRVETIAKANIVAPAKAISDEVESAASLGLSAIITPRKPNRTAPQVQPPTRSPSNGPERAVMMSGAAM